MPPSTLKSLVAPLTVEQFLTEVWERSPFVASPAECLSEILTIDDLDHLLVSTPDDPDTIRGAYCVRSADGLTEEYPIVGGNGQRSPVAAANALADGYTLVINHLHQVHPAVSELCGAIEALIDHPTGCNLYCTPPASQGFAPHYDAQDTFFLQIAGSKTWELWEPVVELPRREDRVSPSSLPTRPPDRVVELRENQVLYMPRGWIHSGHTTDSISLHITVGVRPTTWFDLLAQLLANAAANQVELRRSLPLLGTNDTDAIVAEATGYIRKLAAQPELNGSMTQAFDATMSERLETKRHKLAGHTAQVLAGSPVELDTQVTRTGGLHPRLSFLDEVVRLSFPGGHVEAPTQALDAMAFVANVSAFRPCDVPGLDSESQLALVGGLVAQGFLDLART